MSARTYPVVELFGPTIQGEGPAQGERCWFLRLGGCDYRCTWCDSMMAVDPEQVRAAPRREPDEIAMALYAEGLREGGLLILSGGNPALHHLHELLDVLPPGVRVHVETQGTRFRDWLNRCELVVVSPKPPSAFDDDAEGLDGANRGVGYARQFVAQLRTQWVLKMVAFDELDLNWAVDARRHVLAAAPLGYHAGSFLSAGTVQEVGIGTTYRDHAEAALERYRWLVNEHVQRDDLAPFRVGVQAHVLVWPGELAR